VYKGVTFYHSVCDFIFLTGLWLGSE